MTDGGSDHIALGSFEALQAKVLYPLPETIAGSRWRSMHKLEFLRRFLPFAHGVPSHDQLGNVFARLDARFQSCFIAWVERFTTAVRGVVAVDGKTLRVRLIAPPSRGRSI